MITDKDKEMLELLAKQPEKGLETMMDTYMPLVYTIVSGRLSKTCCREDIEECVSDIFFEFYEKHEAINLQRGTIKAWISVLARRRAIDKHRRSGRKGESPLSLDQMEYEPASAETAVEERIFKTEEKAGLIREILALGEPDSEIFIRKYFYGQSTKEIAVQVAMKENTVDKRVSRGLGKLRQVLGGVQ